MSHCTIACYAQPTCTTCGRRKAPRGRSTADGYCGSDCPGYYQGPPAGHLWPGEEPWTLDDAKEKR